MTDHGHGAAGHGAAGHGAAGHGAAGHDDRRGPRCRGPRAAGHGAMEHGHGGHGDHAAQFRDRFWLSLLLAAAGGRLQPDVRRLARLLACRRARPGSPRCFGTVVFFYGGWPFLTGAVAELRARQPGMMLLIALAITVAFGASAATSLGVGGSTWTSGGSWRCWS